MRLALPLLAGLFASPILAAPPVGYKKGHVHPDFVLPKLDATLGKLSDFRGRKVLLFNFASW